MFTERRGARQTNPSRLVPQACTDGPYTGYTGIDRIAAAARKLRSGEKLTHVMHHLNEANPRQAFRRIKGNLEAIFEPVMHGHSYGFRRGRSPHQALARLYQEINKRGKHAVVVKMDLVKYRNVTRRAECVNCARSVL